MYKSKEVMCNLCACQAQVKCKLLASYTKVNVLKIIVMDCVFWFFFISLQYLKIILFNSYNFYILAPVEVSVCTDGGNECAGNTNGLTACIADACVSK